MRSMEWKQLTGKTLHGSIYLWLVMKKSSVFSAQKSTYFQILYSVLERWTRTHNPMWHGKTDWRGSKVHRNTELWTELMVSQLNSSGMSSQDSPRCSSATKSKSPCLKWAIHQNLKDESSSCRCSMTSHGIKGQQERMRVKCSIRFSLSKKIRSRTMVIPRAWIRKEMVFYSFRQTTRRMGQSRWIDDDQIRRNRTPSFPCHESTVPRNPQKQRRWKEVENYQYTFVCWWG